MTLKDLRDDISRKIAADKSLGDVELNHVTIEDVKGNFIADYLLSDDSDVAVDDDEEEDDYDYEDDSELDDDDDDDGDWWKDTDSDDDDYDPI